MSANERQTEEGINQEIRMILISDLNAKNKITELEH